jgi:transaldolase
MKIFIDTANIEQIKKYLSWGICDGVTTNPSTFLKFGAKNKEEIKKIVLEIAQLIDPLPISVEVTSENPEEIISQSREYSGWANNITVKITVTDSKGNSLLPAINQLVKEGIMVNVTAVMTFNQSILAIKSIGEALKSPNAKKPHFISIFAGRIADEYGVEKAFSTIKDLRSWMDLHQFKDIEILTASIRNPENMEYFSKAGGHIMTIPPEAISKSLLSAKTREAVIQFIEDARKSLGG